MKKFFSFVLFSLLIVAFCVSNVPFASAWYYDDDTVNHNGNTAETAYLISDVENLKLLRDRVNDGTEERGKYYVLTKDLDLTAEHDWIPIGYVIGSFGELGGSYTGPFNGNFDGNGHIISVDINRQARSTESVNVYAGLFGVVGYGTNASIKNLNVRGNVIARAITTTAHDGYSYAGGIALDADTAVIENCIFSGDVKAIHEGNGYAGAGGIVEDGSDVRDCEVKVGSSVSASAAGKRNGDSWAGGIAGRGGDIQGCTSHARILGAYYKGGILGECNRTSTLLENKYSGAEWGIGRSDAGSANEEGSDEGCTYTPLSVEILTKTLSPTYGTLGQRYSANLEASEVKSVKWEVISGDLPKGLILGASGVISGVPTSVDIYNFEVQVSIPGFDSIKDTASYKLEIVAQGQENTNPDNPSTPNNETSSGGGGGGCNAGLMPIMLIAVAVLYRRR